MGIFKDTIKGIPAAAKRLGQDASRMVVDTGVQMAAPRTMIGKGAVTAGQDIGRAFRGQAPLAPLQSYKKGGKVKKTGLAYLHKGEYVETKAKVDAKGRALDKMKSGKIDRSTKKGRYQNMLRIQSDADNHFQSN